MGERRTLTPLRWSARVAARSAIDHTLLSPVRHLAPSAILRMMSKPGIGRGWSDETRRGRASAIRGATAIEAQRSAICSFHQSSWLS